MFVTLVAAVLALVLGHVAPALVGSARRYGWFGQWLQWLDAHAGEGSFWRGRYGIVLALVPPLLLVVLIQWGLHAPWLGLLGFLYYVAVLVYAWGPRDLDVDVEAVIDSHEEAGRRDAIARLWPSDETPRDDGPALVEAVFSSALRRWFGVLFWFAVLGPFGAILFRLVGFACEGEYAQRLPPATAAGARGLRAVLEWPVAQLMTWSMALVGNFDVVLQAWRGAGGAELQLDTGFLAAAARASVKSELAEEAADYVADGLVPRLRDMPELRDAMSLVWRVLLLWLAVMAVFVIAGWVS